MMFLAVKMQEALYAWRIKSRNHWIKLHFTQLKVWKLEKIYGWCFWGPNDSMKQKHDASNGHWRIDDLKTTKWKN